MPANNFTPYLLVEQDVELADDQKIRIVKTKKEVLFDAFKNEDAIGAKIVSEVADDPILLKFLFLESDSTLSGFGQSGITVNYPFCLDPNYDFDSSMESRTDYQNQRQKLDKKMEAHQKEIFDVWRNIFAEVFDAMTENSEIRRSFRGGRAGSLENFTDALKKSLKGNEKLKNINAETFQTFTNYAYEHEILSKIKSYSKLAKDGKKNAKSMHNQHLKLPEHKEQIASAFGKLAKHASLSIESLCLDCWFVKNRLPFTSKIERSENINLIHQCQQCNGTGLLHKIGITYPSALSSLLMFDSSWIYEVYIGSILSEIEWVDHVFVHKKIQRYENGQVQTGLEIDVIVITKDRRLILVEVTKQGDSSNILEIINRKVKNLEEAKIPYAKLLYFTADKQEKYYDVPGNARVFGLTHLSRIESFFTEYVQPTKEDE